MYLPAAPSPDTRYPTPITQRDLRAMLDLLMACRAADPDGSYEHVGDLLWALREPLDLPTLVRLWEDVDGRLVGFALVGPRGDYVVDQVRLRTGSGDLAARVFDWGMARAREVARERGGDGLVSAQACEGDDARIAFLERRGFVRAERHYVENTRRLAEPLPEPRLPEGFALRSFAGEPEVEAYVAMHRDVWGPRSTYTVESHRRLMRNPGYSAALNPIVVAPDGTLAAYCICWVDPVNRLGEIEPLGTRPAFRRMGLGRAVVLESLRLMRAHGVESALVLSASDALPASRLYESAGFRPGRRIFDYVGSGS